MNSMERSIKDILYDSVYFEWNRTLSQDGYINISIPCAVHGNRYEQNYIENVISPWSVVADGESDYDCTADNFAVAASSARFEINEIAARISAMLANFLSQAPQDQVDRL